MHLSVPNKTFFDLFSSGVGASLRTNRPKWKLKGGRQRCLVGCKCERQEDEVQSDLERQCIFEALHL